MKRLFVWDVKVRMVSPVPVRHHPGVVAVVSSSEVVFVHRPERLVGVWPSVSQPVLLSA